MGSSLPMHRAYEEARRIPPRSAGPRAAEEVSRRNELFPASAPGDHHEQAMLGTATLWAGAKPAAVTSASRSRNNGNLIEEEQHRRQGGGLLRMTDNWEYWPRPAWVAELCEPDLVTRNDMRGGYRLHQAGCTHNAA